MPSAPLAMALLAPAMMPAPAQVPRQIPASMGQSRRDRRRRPGPATACQTLVTSDGTTRSAAACAGAISKPSSPIATVGRPRPITPLTKPASRKTPKISATAGSESMTGPGCARPNLGERAHADNAADSEPGLHFHEGKMRFVAARRRSVPYFALFRVQENQRGRADVQLVSARFRLCRSAGLGACRILFRPGPGAAEAGHQGLQPDAAGVQSAGVEHYEGQGL